MPKKLIIGVIWALSLVVAVGGTYYGGNWYRERQSIQRIARQTGMSADQIRSQVNQAGSDAQGGGNGGSGWAGFAGGNVAGAGRSVTGKVDSVDSGAGTVTITTPRGSQKITVPDNTPVSKAVGGSISDIKSGDRIYASGRRNSDGSFEASALSQIK
ncbi:MAG: DUF5666 domain-containing protein [Chloroflexi bacterium]|nr:DUF5666 domain-containing protein [Chloroflexota bacterium]